jgi:hypothetical protein
MTRMTLLFGVVGLFAGARGAEAGYVESHIYLQQQGTVCRATVVDKTGVFVSLYDDGVEWRIENLGCDEPAYVEIRSDIANLMPLPLSCQTTYKVPDDIYFPPRCDFPHLPSYDGTYGFNVYVNCEPGHVCPSADPEIVVERDGLHGRPLNVTSRPSAQFVRVPVTLVRNDGGRCEARVPPASVDKRIRGIEWTFENQCDKEAHYVDLRRVPSMSTGTPMLSRECGQTVTVRESRMFFRCRLDNALNTVPTDEYSVSVDCIGRATCTATKARLTRAQ